MNRRADRRVEPQSANHQPVEQNALAVLEMCVYAYLLESGSLALSGTGRELVDNPHVRSAYLAG